MILSGLIVSTLLWANLRNHYVWVVLFVMTGFGLIGFYDDYLKVSKQTHKGFSGRLRLSLELAIGVTACYRDDAARHCAHDSAGDPLDQWLRRRSRLVLPCFRRPS